MSAVAFRSLNNVMIPSEDGTDLCSVNAHEEAIQWARRHAIPTGHAVILGLGAGYHVKAWLDANPNSRVTVIDFRSSLVRPFRAAFPEITARVEVIIVDSVEGLFHHEILQTVAQDLLPTLSFRPAMGEQKELFEECFRTLTGRNLRGLRFFMNIFGFDTKTEIELQESGGLLTIKDLGFVIDSNHEGHPRAPAVRLLRELIV
jgi:hypothetical protein